MKKVVFLALVAFMMNCGFAFCANSDGFGIKANEMQTRKIYYVVLGSFNTLKDAKRFNYHAPDGLECNIYKTRVKGKIVYRACCNVFKTANEAHECAREIQKFYGINAWVWPSEGVANCVVQETALSGEPIPVRPK